MTTIRFEPSLDKLNKINNYLSQNKSFLEGQVTHIGTGKSSTGQKKNFGLHKADEPNLNLGCNFYRFGNVTLELPEKGEIGYLHMHGKRMGQINRHYKKLEKLAEANK